MPPDLDPAYNQYLPRRRESPTEGMRRIERDLRSEDFEYQERPRTQPNRLGANAGRSIEGYSANIGAQGPLSAGLIGSGDPESGKPQMVGGRVQAGPLSYQYTQPLQRGAPASRQIGATIPFDADAYFGVTAQQTPGQGTTYGANIGNEGWNAYGGYNPSTKAVNVGGGYQASFAKGGPVYDELGNVVIGDDTDYRNVPGYGAVEAASIRAGQMGQSVGEPIKEAAAGIGDIPGSIGSYLAATAQKPDPSQRVAEDIQRVGSAFVGNAMSSPMEFAKTVGGFLPGIGEAISAYDAKHLYSDLQKAKAEGDTQKADVLRQLYGAASAGAVPVIGIGARLAGKLKRGLNAAEGVERGVVEGVERGVVEGAERAAGEGAEEIATAPVLYKPVEEAFQATPEPADVRTMAVDHITESIDATDGAAAQLPTKLGLGPMYIVDSGVEATDKGFLLNSTKNSNAERQLAGIGPLLEEFPDMATDPQQWAQGMSKAFGSKDVVAPPYRFMKALETGEYTDLLKGLTEGQIADADAGFRAGKEFLDAYHTGKMRVEDTGKLFMWGIMSRGVNPFTHEGLFLDAFQGIEPYIKMASEGKFTKEVAEGPYKEWAATTAPKGSGQPGAGAMHNLNAFGEDFLVKMGTPGADGVTPMQKLHDLMSDPTKSGRDIRREFAKVGEGVGIDNKVVSFILLATGRDDVMVIDRIQLKNVWDDGRYGDINIWDGISVPTVELADGTVKRFPPTEAGRAAQREFMAANEGATGGKAAVTGSSLAEATYGAKGILVYEALEDALMKNVGKMYADLGRPEAASPGRFHWETWVARSNQEASHGTLPAILKQAQGEADPLAGIYSKQGDYQTYAYGAKYFRGPEGPHFMMPRSDGSEARLSVAEMSRLQEYLQDHTKGAIPTPTPSVVNPVTGEAREFANTPAGRAEANAYARELTEQARKDAAVANPSLDKKAISAIKVPVKDRGFAVTSAEGRPWHEDQTVNRERVDKLINDAEHRTAEALRQPAEGAVSDVSGSTVARARAAEGFGSGIPRTYGLVDQTVRGRALKAAPPVFDAPVKEVYQPSRKASRVYNADGKSTPPVYELEAGDQSAQAFHSAIKDAKEKSKFGAAVSLYDPAEYKDMRLFLTPDGTAGFALKGDDIVSVFNKPGGPHRGVSNPLLDLAIAQGGRKLDAYDTVLPTIYGESGFKTTSRMAFNPEYAPADWNAQTFGTFNKGNPDVLHMVYDPRHDGSYSLGDGKFFREYDDAVAHQEKNVKTTVNQLEKSRKAIAKAEKLKAQKKAARDAAKKGFAEGGQVEAKSIPEQVDEVASDIAAIAHNDGMDLRHLAYLIRVASGMFIPPERAIEYAKQIMNGDVVGLMRRFQKYKSSAHTFARLNEMMGGPHKFLGSDHMGPRMHRTKGKEAMQRTREAVGSALGSSVLKSRPVMAEALNKISKRI